MTYGSLFAGIGGMDLGLERAGMTCSWQVENNPFCVGTLERHWPNVRRHGDVRTFSPEPARDWRVDLVAGGFPCQDISLAGKGAGLDGARSSLWYEFLRVVRHLRPEFVLVENSPALANRGLSSILGSLAGLGFDAEWSVLPASAFGAVHIRARLFIVAHAQRGGWHRVHEWEQSRRLASDAGERGPDVAVRAAATDPTGTPSDIDGQGLPVGEKPILLVQQSAPVGSGWWATEPDLGRVVHGFPGRVDRIKALGNAVVPQVAEWIGRRILTSFARTDSQ